MENNGYRELKMNPEAKDFRKSLADSLIRARNYDGSEASYESLMSSLEVLEETIETSPSVAGHTVREKEIDAAFRFAPIRPKEINDVLEIAEQAGRRRLHKSLQASLEDGSDIPNGAFVIHRLDGVILPPGNIPGPIATNESGHGFDAVSFEPRLEEIIRLLTQIQIFSDDVLISIGEVSKDVVRSKSYAVIEIPRLNKTILVCDEVGEATFIVKSLASAANFLSTRKQDLTEHFGEDKVVRIIRNQAWEKNILAVLNDEELRSGKPLNKVDVKEYELDQVRAAVIKQCPLDEWLHMNQTEREQKRIDGLSLRIIATIFNVPKPKNEYLKITHFNLGKEIFGPDQKLIKEIDLLTRSAEDWKASVKKKLPTAEEWLRISGPKRRELDFDGKKMSALQGAFGIQNSVLSSTKAFVQLGAEIYGQDDPAIKSAYTAAILKESALERTPEEWRQVIRGRMDAGVWLQKMSESGLELNIDGIGMRKLAKKFSVQIGSPKVTMFKLGFNIYGLDNEQLSTAYELFNKEQERITWSKEQWREHLLIKCPDFATWIEDGKNLKVFNSKVGYLPWIAKSFGFPCDGIHDRNTFSLLSKELYGVDPRNTESAVVWRKKADAETLNRTTDDWRARIKQEFPTAQDWLGMTKEQKRHFYVDKLSMRRLWRAFGLKDIPSDSNIHTNANFLVLGEQIYGVDDPTIVSR